MESMIPAVLQVLLQENISPRQGVLREMEALALQEYIPIVAPEVGNFLSLLVEISGAKRILELGTAIGYSTAWMAQALPPEGLITTIEIDEDRAQRARQFFAALGIQPKVHSIIGDALEVLPHMKPAYDLIFMDAAKGQYQHFFVDCLRLLRPGGLLVADNVFFGGAVLEEGEPGRKKRTIVKNLQSFIDEVSNHPELKTAILPLGDGMTLSVKKGLGIRD